MQLNMLTSIVKGWEVAGTKEPPPPGYNPKSVPGDSADTGDTLGGSMGTFGLERRQVLSDFEHVWCLLHIMICMHDLHVEFACKYRCTCCTCVVHME